MSTINLLTSPHHKVERLKHQETRQLLVDENQKLHLLDTQLYVLQRQLNREQSTFERAYVTNL